LFQELFTTSLAKLTTYSIALLMSYFRDADACVHYVTVYNSNIVTRC